MDNKKLTECLNGLLEAGVSADAIESFTTSLKELGYKVPIVPKAGMVVEYKSFGVTCKLLFREIAGLLCYCDMDLGNWCEWQHEWGHNIVKELFPSNS